MCENVSRKMYSHLSVVLLEMLSESGCLSRQCGVRALSRHAGVRAHVGDDLVHEAPLHVPVLGNDHSVGKGGRILVGEGVQEDAVEGVADDGANLAGAVKKKAE